MKKSLVLLLGAAGLLLGRPAAAQTAAPIPRRQAAGSVEASSIPRLPAADIPGQPGGTPTAISSPGPGAAPAVGNVPAPLYPNGVPMRDVNAGNSRAAQPRSGQAMPGAQPTKSIFKGRKRRES